MKQEMKQEMGYTEYLKFKDIGLDQKGNYLLELELEPIHLSRANLAHGGLVFSLLDSALGRAVLCEVPNGYASPTLEMKINYFRPVASGKITAKGRIVNSSRQTRYAEGEVTDESGRLIACASGTFFIKALV